MVKIQVGHKILNLEELYNLSTALSVGEVEIVVDSQVFAELGKVSGKETPPVTDFPAEEACLDVSLEEARAILTVKLVQLLKLKANAQQSTIIFMAKLLNELMYNVGPFENFFSYMYSQMAENQVYPNDKEKFVLNSLTNLSFAKASLLAYKCREAQGYLNAILAFQMETCEFPLDFFNDYSLTLRGRSTQGIVAFKNQIQVMVEQSKKVSTKPDVNEAQQQMKIPKVYNLHGQMADKAMEHCVQLQHEINSDEASIFGNKKYKELIKLAIMQQNEVCEQILETYTLSKVTGELSTLSMTRSGAKDVKDMFQAYVEELMIVYYKNKKVEDELKAKAEEKKKAEEEAAKADEGNEKKKAKKKGKEASTTIGFGKGTRAFFNYLQLLEVECGKDEELFRKKLNYFRNRELQSIVREVQEQQNDSRDTKCPKGTRDMDPLQMAIREQAFNKIRGIFKKHGASEIDTPVFEMKETLTSKYGEESKLIYDLKDQGGELLSLRYDLTVPFARYVAQKGLSSIKRFHIAKVYRRDNPQMSKGRFREFYQCDFDIAGGPYGMMIPDAELINVVIDIISSLNIGNFVVKLNNRKFLDAMISLAGCEKRKFKAICSSIDKLDKEPWSAVKDELLNQKGLTEEMCAKLEKFVQYKGAPWEMLNRLKDEKVFEGHKEGEETIKEMEILFTYLDSMKVLDKISFDFSLARGLDYYTGVIYECVLTDTNRVGSISGGGRYDGLIGMFSGKNIPSVGGSIGIERIFNILEEKAQEEGNVRATETQILVTSLGKGLTAKRMEVCGFLWREGIKAETLYVDNPRADKTFSYAFNNGIPLILIIGEQEIQEGKIKVKVLNENKEEEFNMDNFVAGVKELIQKNPILLKKEENEEKKE